MKTLEKMIPYCGNCSRKIKKEGLAKDEYYCDVLINTSMNGIVTSDTDGTRCVESGLYKSTQSNKHLTLKKFIMLTNNKYYLIEIFLKVLENNDNDFSREFVRKVRMYIKAPEFADFFNFLLTIAVGGKICIKRHVVNNAIEFLIKNYEKEIEENDMILEKELAKQQMKTYMHIYKSSLTAYMEANLLFE